VLSKRKKLVHVAIIKITTERDFKIVYKEIDFG
jgi:hypothetical protein